MTAPNSGQHEGRHRNVPDVINALGFGLAQVRVMILALGVWFTDGLDICLVTVTTPTMARDFQLTHVQRGSLTTAAMLGVAFGCFSSGYIGDRIGRKSCILLSYLTTVIGNVLTICSGNFGVLFITRLCVGISMGIGMAPSIVMASETTPARWRMLMGGLKGVIALLGYTLGNVTTMVSDPTLLHIQWRALFLWCSIPGAVLGVFTMLFLPESPAFLASTGRIEEAKKVLASMRKLNGHDNISVEFGEDAGGHEGIQGATTLSLKTQLQVIFGRKMLLASVLAIVANIGINLIQYHHNYGEPQVLTSAFAHPMMEPAGQLLLASCTGFLGFPLTLASDMLFPRRSGLVFSYGVMAVLTLCFASTVTRPNPSGFTQGLFQFSMCFLRAVFSVAWNFTHQFSVEIYPVPCSATGGAIAIGVGRFGSIFAPLVYEGMAVVSGNVIASYHLMALAGACIAFASLVCIPKSLEELQAKGEEALLEQLSPAEAAAVRRKNKLAEL